MRTLLQKIGSPNALFAFEAAARHGSFSKAAAELNVSQPAISHAVKRLEESLGSTLFWRRHRSIALTASGEAFYADVSSGLMQIERAALRVAALRDAQHVALSVSTAFAYYWMVPRLAAFRKENPAIDIRLQTTDKEIDLNEETASLAIRRGDGHWPGYNTFLLAPEEIYPVAATSLVRQSDPISQPQDLMERDLIHLEEPFRPRPTWRDWFADQGLQYQDRGEGLRLNDYALVIQAAIAGQGVAMGWHHVVEGLIAQGLLRRLMEESLSQVEGFYVVWSSEQELSPQAQAVLAWLRQQKESSEGGFDRNAPS